MARKIHRQIPADVPFPDQWRTVLLANTQQDVEVIATIREDAINEYLAKHFQNDNQLYKFELTQTFNVNGVDRSFLVRFTANAAVQIDLVPFGSRSNEITNGYQDSSGWIRRRDNEIVPYLIRSSTAAADPNVRIFCPSVSFHIEWPKLDGSSPPWAWDPPAMSILGEANVALVSTDGDYYLRVQPTAVKFAQAQLAHIAREAARRINATQHPRSVDPPDEQKFDDLLVIALNIVGVQYAPQMVENIKIPVPVISQTPILPAFLDISNNCVTIGAGIDHGMISTKNSTSVERAFQTYLALLSQDIENAGGIENLLALRGLGTGRSRLSRNSDVLRSKLVLSAAYVRQLSRKRNSPSRGRRRAGRVLEVADGIAIGVNQYLLTTLANQSLPAPIDHQTGEVPVVPGAVKGSVRYWVHLSQASVAISGTTVSGSVNLDVGGAVDACVRKFWDCSWGWSCGELRLAIVGNPGIAIALQPDNNGIAFIGQLTGSVELDTNLPDPFNSVINFFSGQITQALGAILNTVVSNIEFVIIPPALQIANQNTKIQFSSFTPFAFQNPAQGLSNDRMTFLGMSAGVSAGT